MNMTTAAPIVSLVARGGFLVDPTTGECVERHVIIKAPMIKAPNTPNGVTNQDSVSSPVWTQPPGIYLHYIHEDPGQIDRVRRRRLHDKVAAALMFYNVDAPGAHAQVFNACWEYVNAYPQKGADWKTPARTAAWLYINQYRFVAWNKTKKLHRAGRHSHSAGMICFMRHHFKRIPQEAAWKIEARKLLATGITMAEIAKIVGVVPSSIYKLPHPIQANRHTGRPKGIPATSGYKIIK
jgi:hypothetical protein